jgi:MGT family glycosyltransferase
MAHVAVLPFPAPGHSTPMLPVVTELVSRGHRVSFAVTPELASAVAGAGATPLEYRSLLAGKRQPESFTADYLAQEPLRCIEEGAAVTAQLLPVLSADVPDVVVYDVSTFPTGRALASRLGRPGVQVFPVFGSNETFSFGEAQSAELSSWGDPVSPDHPALAEFLERARAFAAEFGLLGTGAGIEGLWPLLRPCDDDNLVFLPREFQLQAEAFDDRHAFVGPCLPDAGPVPDGITPPGDDPLVLVSLGTTFNRHTEFFRRCAEAFAGQPWRVVITLGTGGTEPADLEPLPPNVVARTWAPHAPLLAEASAFVCHAGMGSMMESLYRGTPLVLVPPDVTEHRLNARRAEELGVGRDLRFAETTAESLRDAVVEMATSLDVRERVAAMARHCVEGGGAARAADVLEECASRAVAPA